MRSSSVGRSRSISPSKQQPPTDSWEEGWQIDLDDWQNIEGKQSQQKKSKAPGSLNTFLNNSAESFDRSSAKSIDWEEQSRSAYSTVSKLKEKTKEKLEQRKAAGSSAMDEFDRFLQQRQQNDSRSSDGHSSPEPNRSRRTSRSPSKSSRQVMRAASSSENDKISRKTQQTAPGHILSSFLEESRTKANKKLSSDERSRGAYSTMSRLKRSTGNSGDLSSMANQKASQIRPTKSVKNFQKGDATVSPRKSKTGLESFLNVNRSTSTSDLETRSVYTSMTRMRRKLAGIEEKPIPKSKDELMSLFKSLAPKEAGTLEKEAPATMSKTQQIKMEAKLSLEQRSARQILRRSRRNSLIRGGTDTGSNMQSPLRRVRRTHEGARSPSRSDRLQRSPRKVEKQVSRPSVYERQSSNRVQSLEKNELVDGHNMKDRKADANNVDENDRPLIRQRSIRKLLLHEEQGSKDRQCSSLVPETASDLSTRRRRSPRKGSRDEWDKSEESSSRTRQPMNRRSFDDEHDVKARRFRQESTLADEPLESRPYSASRSYRRSNSDARLQEHPSHRVSSHIRGTEHSSQAEAYDRSPKLIQRQRSRKILSDEGNPLEESTQTITHSRTIEDEARDATYATSSRDSPRPMQRQRSTRILMDETDGKDKSEARNRGRPIENEAHDASYAVSSRQSPRPMQRQRSTRIVIDDESAPCIPDETCAHPRPIEDEAHDANYASSSRKSPPPIQRQRSTRIVVDDESEVYERDIQKQTRTSESDSASMPRSHSTPRRSGKKLTHGGQADHTNEKLNTRTDDFNSTPRISNKQRSSAARRITVQNLPEMVHEEANEDEDEAPYRGIDTFTFYSWSTSRQDESEIQKRRKKLKESLRDTPLHKAYRAIEAV